MNTHSNRCLLAVTATLGLSLLTVTAVTVSSDRAPRASADLCASVPEPMRRGDGNPGDLAGLAAVIMRAPDANLTGLIGALGQMIVEAELSHAAISGRFEPVIDASVAGSEFALEVCRNTIVGEVSVAHQPAVRFVIGDFDGDGATDVAVRRNGRSEWSVDLGALRHTTVGLGAAVRLRLVDVARPGARETAGARRCRITWLAEGLRAGAGGQFHG